MAPTPEGRLVTLSSDFGAAYAAQVKAVMYRLRPAIRLVDLTHELPRQGVRESAFLVAQICSGFPAGTIHYVVVDPGVGSDRAALAVDCTDGSRLVGPDNGVLGPLARRLGGGAAYRILTERVAPGGRSSATFEGRDVFAPAAVLLADGLAPRALGPRQRPLRLTGPGPRRHADRASGEIRHVDRFGNLITDLPGAWGPRRTSRALFTLEGRATEPIPVGRTYSDLAPGALGALVSSFGTWELSVRDGSAALRLGVGAGHPIELRWTGR